MEQSAFLNRAIRFTLSSLDASRNRTGNCATKVSTTDSKSPRENSEATPERIRLAPSRNQKQRSKLRQLPETSATEPAPAPVAPPPPPTPAPEPPRRSRLKRSGQMHDDLTAPLPEPATPRDEPEY